MKKGRIISYLLICIIAGSVLFNFINNDLGNANAQEYSKHLDGLDTSKVDWKSKNKTYWKKVLNPLQYKVTRENGTERAFSGHLWNSKEKGIYTCSNCGHELFKSETKFKSGTGWPSFYDVISKSNIELKSDTSWGMSRTEVLCQRCGAHLGHLFDDGPDPTGLRYCINSVSLLLKKDDK
jgi:peptide-methionine (R)-S-oxide reductase